MSTPITFVRRDPTQYVLLVAKVGPGTGSGDPDLASRYGVASLKPANTDYATDVDLRDAGCIVPADREKLAEGLRIASMDLESGLYDSVEKRLRAAIATLSRETD